MADQDEFGTSSSLANNAAASPAAMAVPQFSTAEYAHVPGTERCGMCSNLIGGEYFRVNGLMACPRCAAEARDGQPRDSHVAFTRGLVLAAGAALAGLVAYAAFTIITGLYIGYIALGVGWLVAKAMKKGSHGLGGRRYQVAAVLLTYAAISLAAVPIGISYAVKHARAQKQAARQTLSAAPDGADHGSEQQVTKRQLPAGMGALALRLLFVGLASPFLEMRDPVHGLIGLVILFVGLRIAWQLTASAPLEVDGPYAPGAVA